MTDDRFGDSPKIPRFDFDAGIVIFIALALAIFGLTVQTSAGQYMRAAMKLPHDPLYTFRMQMVFFVPALLAGFFFLRVNLQWLRKYAWQIFGIACVLLVCARIAIPGVKISGATFPGVEVNGSWRWINLVFLRFQASDFGKIALVFVLARYLAAARRFFRHEKITWIRGKKISRAFPLKIPLPTRDALADFSNGFLKPCIVIGILCGLIGGIGTDLGTMMLCAAVGFTILFVSGGRIRYLAPSVAAGLAGLSVIVYFWPNRMARIISFFDPEGTKNDEGYQLWQALLGFASGGANGSGLGDGMQYRYFLPEAHTDFVFAVVGEELGFVCTATVALCFLALFLIVASRLRKIPDVFHFNVCLGALLFIVLQALINMGVVTGLLPTKGMSLPFISYGGSNLVIMFSLVGILINAMRNWRREVFPPALNFSEPEILPTEKSEKTES